MVTGIESFKEWFKGNESQYAIIGGTACDILMTEEGLDFRATKDIDLVLIIEAVDQYTNQTIIYLTPHPEERIWAGRTPRAPDAPKSEHDKMKQFYMIDMGRKRW